MSNILCIGAGYVGGPTMTAIARYCPEHKITVVDINEERIRRWNSEDLPIYEPGLMNGSGKPAERTCFSAPASTSRLKKRISFLFRSTLRPRCSVREQEGPQTSSIGKRPQGTSSPMPDNLRWWWWKSTLPVRTAQAMARILDSGDSKTHFEVVSNPEFLAEGTAIQDWKIPTGF